MTMDVQMKENIYFAAFCLFERDQEPEPKCSWSQEDDRKPLRIWGWPQQEAEGNKGRGMVLAVRQMTRKRQDPD